MATLRQAAYYLEHLITPLFLYFAGIIFVLVLFLWLATAWRRNHRPIVPFKTEGGRVEIAPHTLRGILQYAARGVAGVERASCSHAVRRHGLAIRVSIHLRANANLRAVEAEIKRRVRATLQEQFGIEEVASIDIRVSKLVGSPESIARGPAAAGRPVRLDPFEEELRGDGDEEQPPEARG
jgi:uncharacterized alkaline shock family protein YloU